MKPAHLFAAVFAFSSVSSAWLENIGEGNALVAGLEGMLHRRQDNNNNKEETTAASSAEAKSTASAAASQTAAPTKSDENKSESAAATGKTTEKATATATGTNKGTGTITGTNKNTNTKSKSSTIDPRDPAGGISMITPAAIAGPQYYKIGDWVTFGWNYTSLSVTPTAIDILASCAKNSATYTLAVNQTVEQTGKILWDTNNVAASNTAPLIQETYTLLIYDADSSVSATARPGYLAVYNQFTFGMYSPRPAVAWADFKCPGCSGAGSLSANERQTLGFIFGMATITVLSFSWFANGFGIF